MERLFNFTCKGKVIGCYIRASHNTFIEVFLVDEVVQVLGNQNLHHFCLETDDIEDLRHILIEKGYAPGAIKMGADQSYQFWVNDPNGLGVEFQQYTAHSSQLSGRDVEVNW
jgi:lactoylglutathione lyase/glyoxylase I family protein